MEKGGFPEPFLADKIERERWRKLYLDGLILEDILNFQNIHNLKAIAILVELLRNKVASPLSYQSLANDLNISVVTVQKYIELLENLFIIFRIYPYSNNIARSILKTPKLYFYDIGLVEEENKGARFENLIALHLLQKARNDNLLLGLDTKLHYIRDKEKREVNFALVKNNKIEKLIEAKLQKIELDKNLKYFCEKYELQGEQVVFNVINAYKNKGIKTVGAEEFLKYL